MDLAAPVARPAFAWNHGVIMRSGGEGLARSLNAPLIRNESFTGEGASPLPAVMTITAMTIAVGVVLRKLVSLIGH
jgi:multisubunit Na+/H+ antiporter MnhC subunit